MRPEATSTYTSVPTSAPIFLWLGYVFFVVYGSLVPLQYKALPLADALAAFRNIPYLQLGIESRADWVANGVLYVPVGFLTAYMLRSAFPRVWAPALYLVAAAFSMLLGVSVEFTQLFFPPRTVSFNDLIAEVIGSALGITLFARLGNWFRALLHSFLSDSTRLAVLALDAYVLAYLAFSLFPFDFLLSAGELADKSNSKNWGWLLAGERPRLSIVILQLIAETLLTLPFGLLLARWVGPKKRHHKAGIAIAVTLGFMLGSAIEIAQFFIASGVSQGLGVFTRALGLCGGYAVGQWLARHADRFKPHDASRLIRRYAWLLAVPYLAALLEINGWISLRWQGMAFAKSQWGEVSLLPFYYHYYTTESIALFSLAAVSMAYFPVGVLAWANGRAAAFALILAALMAVVIETGKLFIKDAHPDPTNVLIAGLAAWVTAKVLQLVSSSDRPTAVPGNPAHAESVARQSRPVVAEPSPRKGALAWMGGCLVLSAAWLVTFPSMQALVGLVLLGACVAVWHRPLWVFAIIPAALPVFDLAPWSGRFFLDEFDVLVFATLAVAYARTPAPASGQRHRHGHGHGHGLGRANFLIPMLATLFAVAFAISTVRGLMPFALPDANAFNNYFSPYNALRIAKGALWAALIWRLANRFAVEGRDVRLTFAVGLMAGLAMTVAWIIWERVAFPGLFDFSSDYRVTGPFSATHTGGAYIDCFLVAAVPFAIVLTMVVRRWWLKLAGLFLILISTYALVVTYSRGGYIAFAVAIAVVLAALATGRKKQGSIALAGAGGVVLAMAAVAYPVFKSDFMQARIVAIGADASFRQTHWADALGIRDQNLTTTLFGMGVGRFPETKYWRSTLNPKVGTYRLQSEKINGKETTFLRLDSGDAIGVEQFVTLQAGQKHALKLVVRASHSNSKIIVSICEKWLLTSATCSELSADLGIQTGAWRGIEMQVDAKDFSPAKGPLTRPVKLSLGHTGASSTLDIANVVLQEADGADLIQNGNFSQGLDHWFFSIAGTLHAHWRTHNLFVGELFDLGWIGLVTLSALLAAAAAKAAKDAWLGDSISAASLAALCGFVVGGLFDTQIDSPRFLLLLLLMVALCALRRKASAQPSK